MEYDTLRNAPLNGEIDYPVCDGNPLSEHTLQFDWIVLLNNNLSALFANNPNVFVAADLLWYPVKGDNKTRIAPDIVIAFGCLKGPRGSFREWEEGVTPQVVFEILPPHNRHGAMTNRLDFYDKFGVEEYYIYDPFKFEFTAFGRDSATGTLKEQPTASSFISPRLGIRFAPNREAPLDVFGPDGSPFLTFVELEQRAAGAELRAGAAEQRAGFAEQRAGAAEQRASALAAKLRELGIDPDGG